MVNDDEWVEDEDMSPELRVKVLSLKVCRNRCLSHGSSDVAEEIARPILKMFITLLDHAGSLHATRVDEYAVPFCLAPY